MRIFTTLLLLATGALVGCRLETARDDYHLYAQERDPVRAKKVMLGMDTEKVERKMGLPASRTNRKVDLGKIGIHELSVWDFVKTSTAWVPPGNDDTGIFTHATPGADGQGEVTTELQARLTFWNGRLIDIDSRSGNYVETTGELPPEIVEWLKEMRRARGGQGR